MSYTTRKVAAPYTLEHRVYIEKDGVPVSPFHDIPLFANQEKTILNMIVEIPRWTNAKLEVSCVLVSRPSVCDDNFGTAVTQTIRPCPTARLVVPRLLIPPEL